MLLRHDSAAFLQIVADPCPCRHNLRQKSSKYFSISQNRRTFASSIRQNKFWETQTRELIK